MSDRRDRARRYTPSRSRSRSNHRKGKYIKDRNRKQKRSSRSSSRSRSPTYSDSRSRSRSYSRSRSRSPRSGSNSYSDERERGDRRRDNNNRDRGQHKGVRRSTVEMIANYLAPSNNKNNGNHGDQPQSFERSQPPHEPQGFKPQHEPSTCLAITNIPETLSQADIEQALRQASIVCQTSMPDEIHMVAVFKTAYAIFPSVESARKILFGLEGVLHHNGFAMNLDFYPSNLSRQSNVRQAQPSSSRDVNLVQDWICDRCEYKNFARRVKCYKCENPRNTNCKVVYNSPCIIRPGMPPMAAQPNYNQPPPSNVDTAAGANTSLMIRGTVLIELNETELLDAFNQFAPVKDIRMVKNKNTGLMRDFAFVEFYSIDVATFLLNTSEKITSLCTHKRESIYRRRSEL
eukprot:TRINITY_DN2432_c0_g2_i1.p2 TRINITY_DN2432_c0_g2~~TRINITY_DN2432_c0_g2_i1.p2  ORF type:complete len:403 (-),score=63.59 TRINITY_DN2432_c0_g2_i1:1230-2438(-)